MIGIARALGVIYDPRPPRDIEIVQESSGDDEPLRDGELRFDVGDMLADHFNEPADKAVNKVELFEKQVKDKFVNEPGQMRLLMVVDEPPAAQSLPDANRETPASSTRAPSTRGSPPSPAPKGDD